jgi:hypothetical protein
MATRRQQIPSTRMLSPTTSTSSIGGLWRFGSAGDAAAGQVSGGGCHGLDPVLNCNFEPFHEPAGNIPDYIEDSTFTVDDHKGLLTAEKTSRPYENHQLGSPRRLAPIKTDYHTQKGATPEGKQSSCAVRRARNTYGLSKAAAEGTYKPRQRRRSHKARAETRLTEAQARWCWFPCQVH